MAALLLAEFDIDTGVSLRKCIPNLPVEYDPSFFAEVLLPEGSHKQSDDTVVSVLRSSPAFGAHVFKFHDGSWEQVHSTGTELILSVEKQSIGNTRRLLIRENKNVLLTFSLDFTIAMDDYGEKPKFLSFDGLLVNGSDAGASCTLGLNFRSACEKRRFITLINSPWMCTTLNGTAELLDSVLNNKAKTLYCVEPSCCLDSPEGGSGSTNSCLGCWLQTSSVRFCISIFMSRRDKSVRRGAVSRSLALITDRPLLDGFVDPLRYHLERYFKTPDEATLETAFQELSSLPSAWFVIFFVLTVVNIVVVVADSCFSISRPLYVERLLMRRTAVEKEVISALYGPLKVNFIFDLSIIIYIYIL
jgi:hypothetical protein